ncbi:DUF2892 domain-containing protein [Synechocystis salina LEGE 06155]|nr:DUF2892 domain-containing protein [Synechocystis salina LEGE 06155]
MKINLGVIDRLIRLSLASVLFYLGLSLYGGTALGIGLVVVGSILLVTSLVGFCGLYRLLGIHTNQTIPRDIDVHFRLDCVVIEQALLIHRIAMGYFTQFPICFDMGSMTKVLTLSMLTGGGFSRNNMGIILGYGILGIILSHYFNSPL